MLVGAGGAVLRTPGPGTEEEDQEEDPKDGRRRGGGRRVRPTSGGCWTKGQNGKRVGVVCRHEFSQ